MARPHPCYAPSVSCLCRPCVQPVSPHAVHSIISCNSRFQLGYCKSSIVAAVVLQESAAVATLSLLFPGSQLEEVRVCIRGKTDGAWQCEAFAGLE